LIPRRHRQEGDGTGRHIFPPAASQSGPISSGKTRCSGLGAGPKIGQTLSLPRLLLPANDAPVFDQEERTAVRADSLVVWRRNHVEDFSSLQFALLAQVPLSRVHETPFVFFLQ